jgi:transcriptional regulator with XRE-family HTH domain
MPKIASKKNRVQWTRKQLRLSQGRLAELIGTSIYTVQSMETGRLKVSEKNANRLSALTGIDPAWFRADKLTPPLPSATKVRKHFNAAQQGAWKGKYLGRLLPWMFVNQLALLAQAVANKHGEYAACREAGFIDALTTAGLKILATIKQPEERDEVYEAVRSEIKAGGDARILSLLAARNREIQKALREVATAAPDVTPGRPGGELFAAWARAAGIPPAIPLSQLRGRLRRAEPG